MSNDEYIINPLTVFYDERCKRWVDIVPATGAWRFVTRAAVEVALARIDEYVTVMTFFAGIANQHKLCIIRRLVLPR